MTGLLFVAISVAPRGSSTASEVVIQDVRAAASLLAFTNALTVSLFGLVPGTNVGYPATVLGVVGVLFTAAAVRTLGANNSASRMRHLRQLGWIPFVAVTFAFELAAGISLLVGSR